MNAEAVMQELTKRGYMEPNRERIYAAISDAFYEARNAGRTMTDATNDATDAVLAIVAEEVAA